LVRRISSSPSGEPCALVCEVRAEDVQRRLVGDRHRRARGGLDAVGDDDLAEVLHVPAVGLIAGADVVAEGQRGVALDRDVVVVIEGDQTPKSEVPGDRGGLRGDALLEISVRSDREGVVVDQLVPGPVVARGEHPLGERQADAVGDPLAEWAGCRLDARGMAVLGVAGARRAELAEALDVVELEAIAAEIEHRVEQHRRVPAGEHEAVAVRPLGVGRVVAHDPRVERVGDRRECHRRAGVAGVGLLNGVHRERANRVDAQLVERGVGHGRGHLATPRS
jgi:hypothetical protein